MLDTCVIIDLLTDAENLGTGARDLISDPENVLFASCESMRELVVHFNNKKLLNRYFKTSTDVLKAVEEELDIEFLPIRRNVGYASRASALMKQATTATQATMSSSPMPSPSAWHSCRVTTTSPSTATRGLNSSSTEIAP